MLWTYKISAVLPVFSIIMLKTMNNIGNTSSSLNNYFYFKLAIEYQFKYNDFDDTHMSNVLFSFSNSLQ